MPAHSASSSQSRSGTQAQEPARPAEAAAVGSAVKKAISWRKSRWRQLTPGELWNWAVELYSRADAVVSVKFLLALCIGICSFLIHKSSTSSSHQLKQPRINVEWKFVQGIGKDVAGKVNCTNYYHKRTGSIIEIGHGSGGGIAFRPNSTANVSWIWEDGNLEAHKEFACTSNIKELEAGKGRTGYPKAQLFNRYNKVFWVAAADGENVTFRSVLNPVTLTLFSGGFQFQAKDKIFVYLGNALEANPNDHSLASPNGEDSENDTK